MDDVTLSEANVKQAHNAVRRAVDIALDEKTVFEKRLDALETAIERSFDAGRVFDSEVKALSPDSAKDWQENLEGEAGRIGKATDTLRKELGTVPLSPQQQADAMARLAKAEARQAPYLGNQTAPTAEQEARASLKTHSLAITDCLKSASTRGAFAAVRAEQLTTAARCLQATERDIKTLEREGASKSEVHQLKKANGLLKDGFEKEVKALSQEIKKPGALAGMTTEAGAKLVKSVQTLAKGLELGRGR